MTTTTSEKEDVLLCRGIWYVTTLFSVIGLSISLNLLLPSHGSSSSSSSRFLRDGAVSITTFYALTLFRFFIDPPSTTYKEFSILTHGFLSYLSLFAIWEWNLFVSYKCKDDKDNSYKEFVMSFSLFIISLFTGGLGLVQLSDKLRMEIKHAFFTLFIGCLICLLGIPYSFCIHDNLQVSGFIIFCLQLLLCGCLVMFNFYQLPPRPT